MARVKRTFYVSCSGEECIRLSEFLIENMKGFVDISIDAVDKGLYIEIYGYKTDVKNAWNRIKRLIALYMEKEPRARGSLYHYTLESLIREIHRTFPPRLLAEIIRRMGYRVRIGEGYIETDMEPQGLKEIVSRIAGIMDDIKYDVRGKTTKYYVAAASILSGDDPFTVIENSLEKGILGEDEETGKPMLRYEWRQALDMYLSGRNPWRSAAGEGRRDNTFNSSATV